ncbi:hypothetical protein CR64_06425 [Pseudomonas aeruginosa]|uniref:hypothetical protein n=1 Tax=Pseudomonas aeruginosa group TaxID=136841 RepID=UPI0004D44774|nr:hypothetical protein [Pseudomonas aeruginosa]KEA42690.1 hypothetical protein CR64_06425 [Pseudomonas aeruginosa]KSG68609.1 hypothetical protein AO961_27500 [Pseudomonas aeruginosa]MBH4055640.1 hypothetical protein [Pseudomonas aeruginosa]MBI8597415.1 hypothetical protein [Pseudomonas aeruginosa]MCO3914023.1 hypothetical protein [Pseudomonas aeruginosa]
MYLLDSDVAKKICQYNLLHELAGALGCGLGDFAVLPQLKFQLKLTKDDKALAKLGSLEAVDLARQLVASASEVEVVAESANPLLQLNRPDIDSGEATLFAALYGNEDTELLSGDKRAYVALSKVEGMPVIDALWARLICLEEALYLILGSSEFQLVSAKVRARPDVDTSLSIAFGRTAENPLESVVEALISYMRSLEADTSGKYLLPC